MKENGNNSEKEKCFELTKKSSQERWPQRNRVNEKDREIEPAENVAIWMSKRKRKIFTRAFGIVEMCRKNSYFFYEKFEEKKCRK